VFIAQFKSPIILILIGAAVVSLFLQDRTDAALILAMWRKQRKYCSIVTPFRRYHRPKADLCALERTPLDSRDAPNYFESSEIKNERTSAAQFTCRRTVL
jgi:hypothetical protein